MQHSSPFRACVYWRFGGLRYWPRARYSSIPTRDVVDLSSLVFSPKEKESSREPIVLLHGLFGNKRNASSICRDLAARTGREIHALDLRNHGESPHARPMTYDTMARDVHAYVKRQGFDRIALIGHSMGGKVAMAMSLDPTSSSRVNRLVVIDITPARGGVQDEFSRYVAGMLNVGRQGIKSRKAVVSALEEYVPSLQVRMFLMTNWQSSEGSENAWRIPLELLQASFNDIGGFPETDQTFTRPTLFVKGDKSRYINPKTIEIARRAFPDLKMEVIKDASHWVHSDQPERFKDLIVEFCEAH